MSVNNKWVKNNSVDKEMMRIKLLIRSILMVALFFTEFECWAQNDQQVVTYSFQNPEVVKQGEAFKISVNFNIEPEWYIYAPTGANAIQGKIETKVIFNLPPGISRADRLKLPTPILKDGHEVYEGNNILMTQTLIASTSVKPGKYDIKCKVTYQTCRAEVCLAPVTEEIIKTINIQ